jgi:hypothetical protein
MLSLCLALAKWITFLNVLQSPNKKETITKNKKEARTL